MAGIIRPHPARRHRVFPLGPSQGLPRYRRPEASVTIAAMALADLTSTPRHAVAPRRLDGDGPVLLGVAAGVAQRLDLDPLSVRAAFVVMTVAGGWGVALYLVLWAGLVWRQVPPPRRVPSLVDEPTRRLGVLAGV